jgi:hypothetical protein
MWAFRCHYVYIVQRVYEVSGRSSSNVLEVEVTWGVQNPKFMITFFGGASPGVSSGSSENPHSASGNIKPSDDSDARCENNASICGITGTTHYSSPTLLMPRRTFLSAVPCGNHPNSPVFFTPWNCLEPCSFPISESLACWHEPQHHKARL